jgi:hypothetical protein
MHSAILSAYPHIGVHANHMEMGRFSSEEDPGFISIAGELQRWVQKLIPVQGTKHLVISAASLLLLHQGPLIGLSFCNVLILKACEVSIDKAA